MLYRTQSARPVVALLAQVGLPYCALRLSDQWSVFVTPDEGICESNTVRSFRQISWAAPLLYLVYAEGIEWGYQIFHQGRRFFPRDSPADFAPFGLAAAQLAALATLWSEFPPGSPDDQVRRFKQAIGAQPMEWISYRYLAGTRKLR